MNTKRLPYITLLQTWGVILVVFGHTLSPYVIAKWWGVQYQANIYVRIIYNWINSFHMPLFFFISGYLLAYKKYYEKSWLIYIKNRFKRLIIPFYAFSIIIWTPFLCCYIGVNSDVIIKFFSFKQCDHLWFLPTLFVALMIYNALLKTPLKKNSLALTLVVLLIHYYHPHLSLPWIIYFKPLSNLIYVHLGYLYMLYFEKTEPAKNTFYKMWGILGILFIINALAHDFVLQIRFILYPIYRITCCYVIIRSLAHMCSWLADNKLVQYISANMMTFYLWHIPLLIIARRELTQMSPIVSMFILFPVLMIGIVLLIELYKNLKKPYIALFCKNNS